MSLSVLIRPLKTGVELLPLRNGNNTALIKGLLTLKQTSRGPRPFKFRIIDGRIDDIRAPSDAVELLRMADTILLAKQGDPSKEQDIIAMLDGFNLKFERVAACRLCLAESRFSLVDPGCIRYKGEFICDNCGLSELHREINMSAKRMAEEGIHRLFELLLKTRDLDRMLVFLDPAKMDFELTLFDRIQASQNMHTLNARDLDIDDRLKDILPEKLMPVQSLSIEAGLLKGKNQLVVSATATGKTLIGEIAGVQNILCGRGKMLFLVPLVALANQKYDQFTRKYGKLGISTAIRVGKKRVGRSKGNDMHTSLESDIIVGTYEGIDHLLRSGGLNRLGRLGTVVMDEVHMIEEAERGPRLDGLIARLRHLYARCQFIYLSATVGNPAWLAQSLGTELVEFEERPVPLERHLLFGGVSEKLRLIEQLAREEFNRRSKKGYRGQTIVFTHSRQNCHRLAEALNIPAAPYHAGLQYQQRRKIEEGFASGRIPVVVTTAALAAGVDFPASQVIFEGLAMGNEWLGQGEFLQMQGRAGRPDYHDRGVVVVMAEPDRRLGKGESEDQVAFRLLRGDMGPISVASCEDSSLEQILASAAVAPDIPAIEKLESLRLGGENAGYIINKLQEMDFLQVQGKKISLTKMGRIMIMHFLTPQQMSVLKKGILSGSEVRKILTDLTVFDRAFFAGADRIAARLNIRLPSRVFQGGAMEMSLSGDSLEKLESDTRRKLMNFAADFLTCSCKDTPHCGCPERKFSIRLMEMRCEGLSPGEIIGELTREYGIFAYSGDVYEYLETAARHFEAIVKLARILGDEKTSEHAARYLKCIVG